MLNPATKLRFRKLCRRLRAYEKLERTIAELHASRTPAEAHRVIAHFAPLLFRGVGGALFMRDHDVYSCVTTWSKFQPSNHKFLLQECTALHRMKTHLVNDPHSLGCPHVLKATGPYACLPLLRAGQTLGVLHLQAPAHVHGSPIKPPLNLRLAEKFACHCAQKLGELHEHKILSEQAVRDPLTGLYNRRFMEESLRGELQRRGRRSLGVIMLDIDHFKSFNTKYTHSGGDEMLRRFGGFLRERIRGADVACRFGGEEFVLILPGATLEVAQRRAEDIRQSVRTLRVPHHDRLLDRITLSLGVAAFTGLASNAENLLDEATKALRRAKRTGRNRVVAAREPMAQTTI